MISTPYTWDIVIARVKARRDARAESGVDVSNLDSILAKMGRRDKKWEDGGYYSSLGPPPVPAKDEMMASVLCVVVKLEKLHTLNPSLKARMFADEAARLAERVNAWIESESPTPSP